MAPGNGRADCYNGLIDGGGWFAVRRRKIRKDQAAVCVTRAEKISSLNDFIVERLA